MYFGFVVIMNSAVEDRPVDCCHILLESKCNLSIFRHLLAGVGPALLKIVTGRHGVVWPRILAVGVIKL